MVWGIFSCHTLGPFVPIENRLNATAYLSIVADHIHPFMTTVYPSSDGYFQQDNAPRHKAQIIFFKAQGFLNMKMKNKLFFYHLPYVVSPYILKININKYSSCLFMFLKLYFFCHNLIKLYSMHLNV